MSEAIEIEPLLVVAPDTLRAAKFVPLPVRSTVPLLTKDFAVTESDAEGCRCRYPACRCWSARRRSRGSIRRGRSPAAVETDKFRYWSSAPVVDTEAPSRDARVPAMSKRAPSARCSSPSAVLSSMKASFPERLNYEAAAIVLICPLANSIALSPIQSPTLPLKDSRGAEARAARGHVEERLVGAGAGAEYDRARIIDRRRRHLVRRREAGLVCRCCDERAAVGQRPRHGQARSAVAAASI